MASVSSPTSFEENPFTLLLLVSFQVVCVNSFSQMLRRYTSLNHLAQAAHAVLQNSAHINQMLSDLNRVDFNNVQVCSARPSPPPPSLTASWGSLTETAPCPLPPVPSGAGVLGVPVRRPRGSAPAAGL